MSHEWVSMKTKGSWLTALGERQGDKTGRCASYVPVCRRLCLVHSKNVHQEAVSWRYRWKHGGRISKN